MKFKNVAVLAIGLSLLLVSACDNLFINLPENNKLKTYSYYYVVKDICSKNENACLFGRALNHKVVVFIDGGFLFLIKEGEENIPANRAYTGVGMLKQILPYRNIYLAITQDGVLAVADKEKNVLELVEGCIQVKVQNNDIVVLRKRTTRSLNGEEATLSEVIVFNAHGDTTPLTYEWFAVDGGAFRGDTGWFDAEIMTPTFYRLAKSNMIAVYSEPTNNSKAPNALKIIDGVLKVELADGEVVPYKK